MIYGDIEDLINAVIGEDEEDGVAKTAEASAEVEEETSDLIGEIDQALESSDQDSAGVGENVHKVALAQLFAAADILANGRF